MFAITNGTKMITVNLKEKIKWFKDLRLRLTDSFKVDICCKLLKSWRRGGVVTSFYIGVVMVGWSISSISYSQTVNVIKQWISQVLQPTCYVFQKKRYRGS